MDDRIVELVDVTKAKFGLNKYELHTYSIERIVNLVNETYYTLTMEWFPDLESHVTENDLNPDGTAVIEMDMHSHQYRSVIFVNGTSFADGIKLDTNNNQSTIEWLEQETGLVYNQQFTRDEHATAVTRFKASYGNTPVHPSGIIEVKTDTSGNLTLFTNFGYFPTRKMIQEETYDLDIEKIQSTAKKQMQLIDWPIYQQEKLVPIYAFEEVLITNRQHSVMPFDMTEQPNIYVQVDTVMAWDSPLKQPFHAHDISLTEDIDVNTAFENKLSPEVNSISEIDFEKCLKNVRTFLSQVYPKDSEQWLLKTLHREHGYIHAVLRKTNHTKRKSLFQRKLVVILNGDDLEVLTYIDNQPMLDMVEEFKAPSAIDITREEAYKKLKTYLELSPYYVYDVEQKQYILCGKLDCQYAINAENGQCIQLEEL